VTRFACLKSFLHTLLDEADLPTPQILNVETAWDLGSQQRQRQHLDDAACEDKVSASWSKPLAKPPWVDAHACKTASEPNVN